MEWLETERLLLRPRRVEDAEVLRRLWSERDPRVPARRQLDADGRPSVEDLADLIRRDDEQSVLSVVVAESGEVVGYCGLVFGGGDHDPEIVFELLGSAQGQGYATEAARAVVARAVEAGHPRLWATVWDWNVASRRVLSKLGFQETGEVEPGEHGQSLLTELDLSS